MKRLRIEDSRNRNAPRAYVSYGEAESGTIRDAVAYCSFVADDHDTFLLPSQVARLLVKFYGAKEAEAGEADVIDITEERKLFHFKGRPLPRKVALLADRRMHKPGMAETMARLAVVNDQEND